MKVSQNQEMKLKDNILDLIESAFCVIYLTTPRSNNIILRR